MKYTINEFQAQKLEKALRERFPQLLEKYPAETSLCEAALQAFYVYEDILGDAKNLSYPVLRMRRRGGPPSLISGGGSEPPTGDPGSPK